jgi:hypothetical protein
MELLTDECLPKNEYNQEGSDEYVMEQVDG